MQVINLVPASARICPVCGTEMTTVGHSKCEKLDVVPARIVVVERLDERVACPKDDTIVSAPTPPAIVAGGKLGDTLIVESLCDKYIEHQPIERQCTHWGRAGADIAPQTLGRSVAAAIDLLRPVAALIEDQTRAPGLLGTDATGIPVLDPSAPNGIRTGAMWCWTNARWVTFFYAPSADSDSVRRFLGEDLTRTVQCDGTSVTTLLERAGGKRPGCWSHGRRGLAEAARSGDASALDGVRIIAKLFAVERASTLAGTPPTSAGRAAWSSVVPCSTSCAHGSTIPAASLRGCARAAIVLDARGVRLAPQPKPWHERPAQKEHDAPPQPMASRAH